MKRNKLLTALLAVLLIITLTFSLTSCSAETVKARFGEIMQNEHVVKLKGYAIKFFDLLGIDVGQGRPHEHELYEYGFDEDEHWQICDCGEIDAIESHTFSDKGVCSVCGYTSTAHRHVLIRKDAVAPTCDKAGSIEHWECEGCGNCYETEEALVSLTDKELKVAALGHDYGEYTSNEDGTHTMVCSRDPEHIEPAACSGGEAGCEVRATCEYCSVEYGEFKHERDEGTVMLAPTCHEDGVVAYTCLLCGACEEEAIPNEEHDYESTVVRPTCTEAGYTEHTCSKCGDAYTDSEIAPLGHIWDSSTPPECDICGEEKKD